MPLLQYKSIGFRKFQFYVNSSDLELYKLPFSRFGANKLRNEITCHIQHIPKNMFKNQTLRKLLFDILNSEYDYIDTATLTEKVKLSKNVEK